MEEESSMGMVREGNKVLKTITNLVICFKIDENLKDLFHYNEFSASFEYAKDFTWPEHPRSIPKGKRIEDEDLVFLQYYLSHNKRLEMGLDKIRNAMLEVADRRTYHPVKEYLDTLRWDGEPRLGRWLVEGCGAEDSVYTHEVGRKWLVAAVARIYQPGIKFDHVLVLEGKENIGKSSALRVLGDQWFTDSISLLQKEQDIVAKMIGNWIIELAEMHGIRKQENEFIKSFLSCQFDLQRLSFRRDPKQYARQSVFAGTSNNMAYLLDADGNRRFWPVHCTAIDLRWLKANKHQLFAEAKHIYNEGIWSTDHTYGEKLFLEGEALSISRSKQKMRLGTDEVMEEAIYKFLLDKDETTMREILMECFHYQQKDLTNRSQTIIIGRILKKLGFEKKERKAEDGSIFKYMREKVVGQVVIEDEQW